MGADNTAFIVQAAKDRRAAALRRATEALQRLDRAGSPITFKAVAQAAAVSRAWLYREPSMRAEIERLRGQHDHARPVPPAAQRASGESLQRRLEAALAEIARLKQENRQLRERVARLHGERRAAKAHPRPAASPGP